MGRLTTHVLDTARGMPAVGISIELFSLHDGRTRLKIVATNKDGRCDAPLLEGPEFSAGRYELVFAVGEYFRKANVATSDPPFLDYVPIQFQVADPAVHYHVPLLVSPFGYTTYRGS
jgi:5-hydroxyisourate hydrolase